MQVRTLAPDDVDAYRELMLEAYAREGDAFTSTVAERAGEPASWWLRRIADPRGGSVALGAFEGVRLLGSVALEFSDKTKTAHKAHLIGMYVRPDARGQGVARALLDEALARCRGREATRVVQLTVTEGNDAAVALYLAAGFAVFGREPMAIRVPGGFRTKLHMWCNFEPHERS